MVKRAVALGIVALLGCHKSVPKIEIQRVEVPVALPCPEPPVPVRPSLPLGLIGPGSRADEIVKAYAASIVLLQGYARELERIIEGYRGNYAIQVQEARTVGAHQGGEGSLGGEKGEGVR